MSNECIGCYNECIARILPKSANTRHGVTIEYRCLKHRPHGIKCEKYFDKPKFVGLHSTAKRWPNAL